jgi:drug/metabolite transporter (DMT)-like permease
MFFWGTSFVFTTIALEIIDPISIVFIRLLISAIILWAIVAIFFRKEKTPFHLFKWIAVLAFFEPFIYFLGETYGLQRVNPVITSLIISTIPVFTAIVMRLFFKAKLTTINFIGIFISLSGVILILIGKNLRFDVDVLGLLLLFLAVFAAVGYGIFLNKLAKNVHPVWLIASQNTFATLCFFPLYIMLRETPNFNHATVFTFLTPQWEMWTCILLLSIFSSSLAFIFYSMAVRKIGVARGSVFANLVPIFTAITSFFLLGEYISITKIAGIFIVIFGLTLTQRKK